MDVNITYFTNVYTNIYNNLIKFNVVGSNTNCAYKMTQSHFYVYCW
jgi:hypothetical protein